MDILTAAILDVGSLSGIASIIILIFVVAPFMRERK